MNLFDIFRSTLTDMSIVSAITSTVFIILLGFVCRKKGFFLNLLENSIESRLNSGFASTGISSFHARYQYRITDARNQCLDLGISYLYYSYSSFKTFFLSYKGDKQTTLRVLTIFGSTTFSERLSSVRFMVLSA